MIVYVYLFVQAVYETVYAEACKDETTLISGVSFALVRITVVLVSLDLL